jgi:hypothetical protein
MDAAKTNWVNGLKKISKDIVIAERSVAHDDEVSSTFPVYSGVFLLITVLHYTFRKIRRIEGIR